MAEAKIIQAQEAPSSETATARIRPGPVVVMEATRVWHVQGHCDWPIIGERWCARYNIEREIGRGGSSVVFQARDQESDGAVAVKVLRHVVGGVEADRFAREIRLMRQVIHPGIMPVYDDGAVGGTLFYVMPYYGSETLGHVLERSPILATADALHVLSDLAKALAHLHAAGFVHRDIKPGNVLMTEGRAIVADFGCAAAVDQTCWPRITQSGCCPGTPEYMSPEQFWDPDHVGVRADVYSLACLAFEMLTGRTPYSGDARRIAVRHLTAPIPHISQIRGASFRGADQVVSRALAKESRHRHATPLEFVRDLRAALRPANS